MAMSGQREILELTTLRYWHLPDRVLEARLGDPMGAG
jgi:hypothetical protein